MKWILNLVYAMGLLCVAGCTTLPTPTKSAFFTSKIAGHTWRKDGSAMAVFSLGVSPTAPDVMFVEAVLPDPSRDSSLETIRKEVKKSDGVVTFEGERASGWKSGAMYTYAARVYADATYTTLLGTHEQRMKCVKPPDSILSQLKDP